MKSCSGCKHLSGRHCYVHPLCAARLVHDPVADCNYWWRDRLPDLALDNRSEGGPCGPDALLYAPTFWQRLRRRLRFDGT